MGCNNSTAKGPSASGPAAPTLLEKPPADGKPAFTAKLGAVFPDFECETTAGKLKFHEFLERQPGWTVLFSHPKAFTPTCTTELALCSGLVDKLSKMGVKMIGLSCDSVAADNEWAKDVLAVKQQMGEQAATTEGESDLGFPIIADEKREIASSLGMLDPKEKEDGMPLPARALFLIGPDKTNRAMLLYPAFTGRNFAELARVIESIFLTRDFKLATPANWQSGERVIVTPAVSDEDAQKFSNLEVKELPSGKKYLRYVDCPKEPPEAAAVAAPGPAPSPVAGAPQDFSIKLGAAFPDFPCKTTEGDFNFHEFLDREPKWTVLFSHPKDFTPVCTTELCTSNGIAARFQERGCKLIGLSCDPVEEHNSWAKDILSVGGQAENGKLAFPLIGDEKREIATRLGMLDPNEKDAAGIAMPARALFFIGPDKTNRATILYPATTGRDFEEVYRVLVSLQMTEEHKVATPGNWKLGERVIVPPSVTEEEAKAFSNLEIKDLPSQKPYLRYVDCPDKSLIPPSPAELNRDAENEVQVLEALPGKQGGCCF